MVGYHKNDCHNSLLLLAFLEQEPIPMNYFLARDGQTYGPYPEENFPSMLAAGQVLGNDLICPEGSSQWMPLERTPAFSSLFAAAPAMAAEPAAPASAPASSGLRVSASTTTPHVSAPAPTRPVDAGDFSPPKQKGSWTEKIAGAWGMLKLVGFGVVALVVAGSFILGFFAAQRDKKEIAKLQSLPGWTAFNAANRQIDSESVNAGFGNNDEAAKISKLLASGIETVQRENFVIEKSRPRGRSKLGRVVSAVDSATAGKGHFETFVELRKDRTLVLIHVPEFKRYKGETRESMRDLCWEAAHTAVKAGARKAGDLPLVVGIRDSSSYDTVYVGNLSSSAESHPPRTASDNVASHKLLVQWFGEEKP